MIVLDPYFFKGFYAYDPDMGFRVRGGSGGSNQFGFNDREYPLDKPPGIIRVLVLGDSFSWAGRMDENYTAILEKKFESHYGKPIVQVINAGYPMTHTGEQFELLKKFGLLYSPDLVFLGFFCGNDFVDADPLRKRIVVSGTYLDIDVRKERTILGYQIIPQSRLWNFIQQRYRMACERFAKKKTSREIMQSKPINEPCTFSKERFLVIEKARLEFFKKSEHENKGTHPKVQFIFRKIDEMNALLASQGIDFTAGLYPDEFQVSDALKKEILSYFELNPLDYDFTLAQDILIEHLSDQGIDYIDLLPELRSRTADKRMYQCQDTHWNDDGSECAASLIFDFLLPRIDRIRAQMK